MLEPEADRLMLSEMSACAYRLGMAFGREAERAVDWKRQLEFFRLFDRCFFSLRVAIALKFRLGSAARAAERAAGDERSERERPESLRDSPDRDRERDREVEPASLPVLIGALEGIAADAAALPGPEPADLPTLRELIARAKSTPAPVQAPRVPPTAASLRTRLAGSATAAVMTAPAPPRPAPGLAVRRATGPPRR